MCNINITILSYVNNKKLYIFIIQIEREKADVSVQLISLSERLEEAEGGADNQVCYHNL